MHVSSPQRLRSTPTAFLRVTIRPLRVFRRRSACPSTPTAFLRVTIRPLPVFRRRFVRSRPEPDERRAAVASTSGKKSAFLMEVVLVKSGVVLSDITAPLTGGTKSGMHVDTSGGPAEHAVYPFRTNRHGAQMPLSRETAPQYDETIPGSRRRRNAAPWSAGISTRAATKSSQSVSLTPLAGLRYSGTRPSWPAELRSRQQDI